MIRPGGWFFRPGVRIALAVLPTLAPLALGQEEQGGGTPPPVEDPPAVAETPPAVDPAPPPRPGPPAFDHPLSIEEIEAAAADLVTAHPSLVRLETVGISRGGRSIVGLVLTDSSRVPAGAKPGLLLVDHRGPGGGLGAEIGLALAWDLAERHGSDPEVARLLGDVAFTILPALDPDAWSPAVDEAVAPARPVDFDRNFPVGWLPEVLRSGGGDYPLSEPETLATARFLESHPEVVMILDAVPLEAEPPPPGEGLPDVPSLLPGDREAYGDVLRTIPTGARPWSARREAGGSLLAYAAEAQGAFAFLTVGPRGAGVEERVAAGRRTAVELALRLPRVALRETGLVRLGPGLWQLDVVLENGGVLPTRSALARKRFPRAGIQLTLGGAKLVATAARDRAEGSFQVLTAKVAEGESTVAAGNLPGGGARGLRLILQAEAGTEVTLVGSSSSAGTALLRRILP